MLTLLFALLLVFSPQLGTALNFEMLTTDGSSSLSSFSSSYSASSAGEDDQGTKASLVTKRLTAEGINIVGDHLPGYVCSADRSCADINGCFFTSTDTSSGACEYKRDARNISVDAAYTTEAFVPGPEGGSVNFYIVLEDCDTDRSDVLRQVATTDYTKCLDSCSMVESCRASVWTDEDQGTCYLKTTVGACVAKKNAVMGIRFSE